MHRYYLLLLFVLAASAARAQFPGTPPCGSALEFRPTHSEGIYLPDQVTVPDLAAPSGAFTIEAWVRYDSVDAQGGWPYGFHSIAAFGEANRADRPLLNVRFGALEVWDGQSLLRGGAMPLDRWAHVAYTWDGTTNRLYIDGEEVASSTSAPRVEGTHFYVGYSRGSTGWRGLIDEVVVWNRARTAEDILYDARGLLTGAEDSLQLYLKFDGTTREGTTGQDYARDEVRGDYVAVLGWTDPNFRAGSPHIAPVKTPGPTGATVLSCKLHTPLGLTMGRAGELLIAEAGTGHDDGAIRWWTTGMTTDPHPLMTGLTSRISLEGMPAGTNKIAADADGRVLFLHGLSEGPHPTSLLVTDTTRTWNTSANPFEKTFDIGAYALQQGFGESNPYAVAVGPEGDYFVVDAAANALFRVEDETGSISTFARLNPIDNPNPGPMLIDAVPTSIVFGDAGFFVGAFTGFPYPARSAVVYELDLDGNVQTYQHGLTTVVDLARDPRDGSLLALEFGGFDPEVGFVPEAGTVVRLHGGTLADTLITGLTMPTAMAFDDDGSLYVATLQGQLLYYEADATRTDAEAPTDVPQAIALDQNYPNPFVTATRVPFTLHAAQHVRAAVYDVLGREVAVLTDQNWPAGTHALQWIPQHVPSGVYFFRLETEAGTRMRQGVLLN